MLVNNQLCIYGKSALLCQNNGFPHLHFSEKPLCHLACHPPPCYLRDDENRFFFSFFFLPASCCWQPAPLHRPTALRRICRLMNSSRRSIRPKWRAGSWKRNVSHGGSAGMGEPEQKMAGRMNGKNTERWIYTRSGTGLVPGPGRRRIPGQGFRHRHRDRHHDAPGQPLARLLQCPV